MIDSPAANQTRPKRKIVSSNATAGADLELLWLELVLASALNQILVLVGDGRQT